MKEQRWALDSAPVSPSMHETWDYSGLQLHGLSSRPLSSAAKSIQQNGNEWLVTLKDGLAWNDGTPITGRDYLAGLRRLFSGNPPLAGLLFRFLSRAESGPRHLRLVTNLQNNAMGAALRLPNLSPHSHRASATSSGPFVQTERRASVWKLERNPHYSNEEPGDLPDRVEIALVKDPLQNLALFEKGLIDVTADTAFPFESLARMRNRADLRLKDTGLAFYLVFEGEMAMSERAPIRRGLAALINRASDEIRNLSLSGAGSPIAPRLSPLPVEIPRTELTLAYDEYYPNRSVAQAIQDLLFDNGVRIRLETDDFHARYRKPDLRLVILRGPSLEPFTRLASHALLQPLRSNRELLVQYLSRLDAWSSDNAANRHNVHIEALGSLLADAGVLIPLFTFPSISLVRGLSDNPIAARLSRKDARS